MNDIHSLRMGDERVEDAEGIKRQVEDFFKNLYTEGRIHRPKVDGLILPRLDDGHAD